MKALVIVLQVILAAIGTIVAVGVFWFSLCVLSAIEPMFLH